jgi:hypothetical protein
LRRAGDAVYADVRVSLADGLRLSSDENNFQLFREGTKPNPFIGASPRRLSGLLELLKNYPVSKNALFSEPFIYKTIFLPRQARDNHRENSETEWCFLAAL